jgi:hypothetical protein
MMEISSLREDILSKRPKVDFRKEEVAAFESQAI